MNNLERAIRLQNYLQEVEDRIVEELLSEEERQDICDYREKYLDELIQRELEKQQIEAEPIDMIEKAIQEDDGLPF